MHNGFIFYVITARFLMQITKKTVFVSFLIATSFTHVAKAHHPSHHEHMFAESASRNELAKAYLTKCAETHHFADELEKARCYQPWITPKQAFGVGAVSGAAVMAILWILSSK